MLAVTLVAVGSEVAGRTVLISARTGVLTGDIRDGVS
jgi:hypothetical protein